MIETKHLRVGNIVVCAGNLEPEGKRIDTTECVNDEHVRVGGIWHETEDLFGVKLNRKTFKCISGMVCKYYSDFDDFYLTFSKTSEFIFEQQPDTDDYSILRVEAGRRKNVTKEKNIQYLHELQNIFFALTGVELDIDINQLNKE